jgi:quercetin dioxygenase-like cupin family protein
MQPELRLIEDFMTDRGALSLPALPRMLYVVRGTLAMDKRVLGAGEAFYSEDAIEGQAQAMGATVWRWELIDPRQPDGKVAHPSVLSHVKLAAPLASLPDGELLWRGDSVAFPPGGSAYRHRHQGPGIRCLIEGTLRVDTAGQSNSYEIGDPWFESGSDPVVAQAGSRATRFIRVLILPRALIGKSSIQYVDENDKAKPKTQQYRVFVDAPLRRSQTD